MKKVVLKPIKINDTEYVQIEAINVQSDFLEKELQTKWNESVQHWCIVKAQFTLNAFFSICRKSGIFIDYRALKTSSKTTGKRKTIIVADTADTNQYIKQFSDWMQQKRYSPSTQKTYTQVFGLFVSFYKNRDIETLEGKDIERFINEYVIPNNLSTSYQNQVINACKLFYSKVLGRNVVVEKLERPKSEYKLPHVLSKSEVKRILQVTSNSKHRAILSLIYACGLRRNELIQLKINDIQSDRHTLMVRGGKGKRDRRIPISTKTIGMLREYYKTYKPKYWLFEGQKEGMQYSPASIRAILKTACKKAGINKQVTPHWLRHSYATHLMESGTDTRYIQELLGHKSIKTTTIYTHVTEKSLENIRSPFDDL